MIVFLSIYLSIYIIYPTISHTLHHLFQYKNDNHLIHKLNQTITTQHDTIQFLQREMYSLVASENDDKTTKTLDDICINKKSKLS